MTTPPTPMLSVEEAIERILEYVHVLPTEDVPILDALNLTLAEDIVAGFNIPPLDNSAMDGYAVRAADVANAGREHPVRLRLIGEVAAGYTSRQQVELGTAIRIFTGAPLPPGADTVIPSEDTDDAQRGRKPVAGDEISIYEGDKTGANIRNAGEDIQRGVTVIKSGTILKPAAIGVLASLGHSHVKVIRRARIAILSTGDEIVEPGGELQAGQIYNSNSYSVAALVKQAGAEPVLLGIARDNRADLVERIRRARESDMLLTSGGVSMGDYDLVRDVLASEGTIGFWRVRMRPGKPLAFGMIGETPHLGLPGNPVSSMVVFEEIARPAIWKMMGRSDWQLPVITATLTNGRFVNHDGRRSYLRAIVTQTPNGWEASLTGPQGSGILTSMLQANGLLIVPEDAPLVEPGMQVKVQMIEWE